MKEIFDLGIDTAHLVIRPDSEFLIDSGVETQEKRLTLGHLQV